MDMQRIPEPELMDSTEQAIAYSRADFSAPNDAFVEGLIGTVGDLGQKSILDIGCGPGDICKILAVRFPGSKITGIDGSRPMLDLANRLGMPNLDFQYHVLPDASLPGQHYDIIISNSLLHHLHQPEVLWHTIQHCGKPNAQVYVMDLFRMSSIRAARAIVAQYAVGEPEILKTDFYNSLLAAFTVEEVKQQLSAVGLVNFKVVATSDHHMLVQGCLPG